MIRLTAQQARAAGLTPPPRKRQPRKPAVQRPLDLPAPTQLVHYLTIPNWRPTPLNQLMYTTVCRRIKLKKADREMVAFYAMQQKIPLAVLPRKVSIEVGLSGRQRQFDQDSPQKSLFDALVHCGALTGDTAGEVQWGGVTFTRGKSYTTIRLEELP